MKRALFLSLIMSLFCFCATAQQGTTISLKGNKPPEDANKLLRAEKTGYDKLPKIKKFLQNTYVHYNYLFNANQIYNHIMQDAIAGNKDDYSQLLRFYPYDENALASNKQFDSVIQHATAGLLLHDLRNDYVDELYFVSGKSYFFEKKYDTAAQTFLYINYAFAPKDDGYDIPVGSNISSDKNKAFSISSKEAGGLQKNNLNNINRRNDALLWLARNYTVQENYTQAGILLNNLGRDAQLPERLQPLYLETRAYFFYRQRLYDSAAAYLAQCNFKDDTKYLKARRSYLTAQLFQLANNDSAAIAYYTSAAQNSNDPLIDIYAQKNIILLQNTLDSTKAAANDLNALLKKNKYFQYRDLIYYNEAEIARAGHDDTQAIALLRNSIRANSNILSSGPEQKSKAYLLLGDIDYDNYRFDSASRHYDSVSAGAVTDTIARARLQYRQPPLKKIAANYDSVFIQDSLLTLANMPEQQRMEILKQKAKQIRRAIDRREDSATNIPVNGFVKQQQQPIDLFAQSGNSTVWYFNNPAARSSGYQLFKQRWGNRPNTDNWQRLSALSQNIPAQNNSAPLTAIPGFNNDGTLKTDSADITAEDLLAGLPMTAEKKNAAVNIITKAMLDNGETAMNQLENFPGAIALFDSLIGQYPQAPEIPKALYDQYVCYMLMNQAKEAEAVKNKLLNTYPKDTLSVQINSLAAKAHSISPTSIADSATKVYSDIYDLFLSGNFDEALRQKSAADKRFGNFYWTPQLLYIEAIYNASKRNDTAALNDLHYIVNSFSQSPIVPQAKNMIDILMHRKAIEDYLTKLHIQPEDYSDANMLAMLEQGAQRMQQEKRIALFRDSLAKFNKPAVGKEAQQLNAPDKQSIIPQNTDTAQVAAANNPPVNQEAIIDSGNQQRPVPNNIDTLQAINNPANQNIPVQNNTADTSQAAKPVPHTDSTNISNNNPVQNNNTQKNNPPVNNRPVNNEQPATRAVRTIDGFTFDDNAPVYVTIILDKSVDVVYVSEAGNAFNRYNLLTFPNQTYSVNTQKIGDDNVVLIGPFKNLQEANDYQSKVEPQASTQIIFWIADSKKYSFLKISPQNLSKLHSKDDINKYRAAAVQAGSE